MNRQPYERPPRWWEPKLSLRWIRIWKSVRLREQRKKHRLMDIEVRGLEPVREALEAGCGVMITPNHASHADCFALYHAVEQLSGACYAMVAWQVFPRGGRLRTLSLQHHGCFSIDREGTGKNALRQARNVLTSEPFDRSLDQKRFRSNNHIKRSFPLAIFPEGDVYHTNDRVTPFREGPAAIAVMAARKTDRPIVVVPCAIKYEYIEDPTPELLSLLDRLEEAMHWRPRPDLDMPERIYQIAEGMIALKEIEILGAAQNGSLPDRIEALIETVLKHIEPKYDLQGSKGTAPERVKAVRQRIIERLGQCEEDCPERTALQNDMDDIFMVMQAFSYPGDYVSENPTIERIAETLDKFEEDVLGASTATIRAKRKATVVLGEPIPIDPKSSGRKAITELTQVLESNVQSLLDGINGVVASNSLIEGYREPTAPTMPEKSEAEAKTKDKSIS
jgi:hypothetical protein